MAFSLEEDIREGKSGMFAINYFGATLIVILFWEAVFYMRRHNKQPKFVFPVFYGGLCFLTFGVYLGAYAVVTQSYAQGHYFQIIFGLLIALGYTYILLKVLLPIKKSLEIED
ncbi:hypothetical protein K1728_04260 [Weissella confusa]|uniref:hypothetical protein n=1 Tax=Weissella confusa TaxID=1583 RepID=UPI001C6F6CAF|nr:hypothetical protein [Weissella confusa]QYU58620.1 hypothetical protein K1728_04260 [Weissella confusa]